jgi:hypothetical protein
MAFLIGQALSEEIRRVLSGRDLRCAVAFWGLGAAEFIQATGTSVADARIVCDLSMGGCWPGALEEMGDPGNKQLRQQDGLHAKVYISDTGIIVGSPDASANGIGFKGCKAIWLEAGTFHAPKSQIWRDAAAWFERLYRDARVVDGAALEEARRRWPKTPVYPKSPVRKGSILDLVSTAPEKFGTIGFVFADEDTTPKARKAARQNLKNQLPARANEIVSLPDSGMFTGWEESDLERWPSSFIEFWLPRHGKLSVYGRQVQLFGHGTGSVFTKKSWSSIRSQLPENAPKAASIAAADAGTAAKLLSKHGSLLYSSPKDLALALLEL